MSAEQAHLQDYASRQGCTHNPNLYREYRVLLSRFRYIPWLLVTLAAIFSISMNVSVFQSDTHHGNIFVLLFLLLAPNFLSLLLWLYALIKQPNPIYQLCEWLAKFATNLPFVEISKTPSTRRCLVGYVFQPPYGQWLAASITHGFWFVYLLAGTGTIALYLSFNQVSFYWETTLLDKYHFYTLTQYLSVIPSWFGIAEPSFQTITFSQVGGEQTQAIRFEWAVWLLANILIYGLLPRAGLWILSMGMYIKTRRAYLRSPTLTAMRSDVCRRVIDTDTAGLSTAASSTAKASGLTPLPELREIPNHAGVFGFEWHADIPMMLRHLPFSSVNDRAEQSTCLAFLTQTQDPTFILVACDTAPDRGSRRFFQQVANLPGVSIVLTDGAYLEQWQQMLVTMSANTSIFQLRISPED